MNIASASKSGTCSKTRAACVSPRNVPKSNNAIILSIPYYNLSTNWEDRAAAWFFHNYVSPATSHHHGYLGFLPELLSQTAEKSPLRSAILAAGFASLANTSGMVQLSVNSRRHYGKALQNIGNSLEDPTEASSDAALATIVLLQKYEVRFLARTLCFDLKLTLINFFPLSPRPSAGPCGRRPTRMRLG
jgi:hypothetical protein